MCICGGGGSGCWEEGVKMAIEFRFYRVLMFKYMYTLYLPSQADKRVKQYGLVREHSGSVLSNMG